MKYEFIDEKSVRIAAFVDRGLGELKHELSESDTAKLSCNAAAVSIRLALLKLQEGFEPKAATEETRKLEAWNDYIDAEIFGAFIASNIKALEGVHLEHDITGNDEAKAATEKDIQACKAIQVPKIS